MFVRTTADMYFPIHPKCYAISLKNLRLLGIPSPSKFCDKEEKISHCYLHSARKIMSTRLRLLDLWTTSAVAPVIAARTVWSLGWCSVVIGSRTNGFTRAD